MARGSNIDGRGGGAASALGLGKAKLLERGKWPPARMVAEFKCWSCQSRLRAYMDECKQDLGSSDDITRWQIGCPVCDCVVGLRPELFKAES